MNEWDCYDSIPVSSWMLSKEGVVLAANERARLMLRAVGPNDELGLHFHDDDAQRWKEALRKAAQGTLVEGLVLRVRKEAKASPCLFLQCSLKSLRYVDAVVAIAVDVTDSVGWKRYYEQVLNSVPDMVFVKSKGSRFHWANKAMLDHYGFTQEQLSELIDTPFSNPDHTRNYVRDDNWVWKHKRQLRIECEPATRHDGVVRKFETIKSPIFDEDGEVVFMVGVARDITEKIETEEKAAQSTKMASLGEMAGGVAHEINSPLSVMMAKAHLLRMAMTGKTLSDKNLEDSLATIERNGERVTTIIKGLRRFSREGSADPFQSIPVAEILDDLASLCGSRFRDGDVELRIPTVSPDVHLTCRPVQITQILLNLLNNALDAIKSNSSQSEGEPWVEMRVDDAIDALSIRVLDSGPGVPEAIEKRMMEPFFTTKPAGQGTGLGLSIASAIAKENRGTLKLDRRTSASCFLLTIDKGKREHPPPSSRRNRKESHGRENSHRR